MVGFSIVQMLWTFSFLEGSGLPSHILHSTTLIHHSQMSRQQCWLKICSLHVFGRLVLLSVNSAVRSTVNKGVTVVVAAGNDDDDASNVSVLSVISVILPD